MKYYCVYDISEGCSKDSIIAFHNEKRVARKFIKSLSRPTYGMGIIKESILTKIPSYEDLYLVKLGHNYVPVGFYDIAKDQRNTELSDLRSCSDTLTRVLALDRLDGVQREHVEETVLILSDLIHFEKRQSFDISLLEEQKKMYDNYKYYCGIGGDLTAKDTLLTLQEE